MKCLIFSCLGLFLVFSSNPVMAAKLKCETAESETGNSPTQRPLSVKTHDDNIKVTQDKNDPNPNKPYYISLPELTMGSIIEFSSEDGMFNFHYTAVDSPELKASQMSAKGPNGISGGTGSESLDSSLSIGQGQRAAFVYCNEIK